MELVRKQKEWLHCTSEVHNGGVHQKCIMEVTFFFFYTAIINSQWSYSDKTYTYQSKGEDYSVQ